MKLKLTKAQFNALFDLLGKIVGAVQPQDMEDVLYVVLMASIYKKMYAKAIINKPHYSLKLTHEEAVGFWIFFADHALPKELVFEINLVQSIRDSILPLFIHAIPGKQVNQFLNK